MSARVMGVAIALAATALSVACATGEPRMLVPGTDACEHCRMTVSDARFAAQVVTTTGKTHVFDDAGCLSDALRSGLVPPDRVGSVWLADFRTPGHWIAADAAFLVRSSALGTPMGSGLAALRTRGAAAALAAESDGEVLRWPDVGAHARGHH